MWVCVYIYVSVFVCVHTCTLSMYLYVPPAHRSLWRPEDVLNPLSLELPSVTERVLELNWRGNEHLTHQAPLSIQFLASHSRTGASGGLPTSPVHYPDCTGMKKGFMLQVRMKDSWAL